MNDQPPSPSTTRAADASIDEVSLYQAHEKIYPRSVSGWFSRWRWVTVWITQIVFYGVPWLQWNDRQAILFELESRRFFIFNWVLYPQDFIYLTGLLVIAALSLFLFTAVAGRLWCGFACPQTVYTEIFLWIEKKVEGDRSARMRLDQGAMSIVKIGKKWLKHALWMLFGLYTGFTFVGYFTPIQELAVSFATLDLGPWQTFWVGFYGLATYGNAGFMREQVCKYMCPYARFQSAMFDSDTMIVTYDHARGEPRGARAKQANVARLNLGACIDCTLCVQVCPTGIDIRNGLQYECIGCGACADVCDTVMDKLRYPRGLVKFSTHNGMTHGWTLRHMLRRVFRARVLVYSFVLLAITVAVVGSLFLRTPLKVDVIRDRGSLARMVEWGRIENVFRLQVLNATEDTQHYEVTVQGLPGIEVVHGAQFSVLPTEVRGLAVTLQVPPQAAPPGSHPIVFHVQSPSHPALSVSTASVFIMPR